MSKPFNQKADEAVKNAVDEYEAANENYIRIIQRYLSSKSSNPGDTVQFPEANLDMKGLKEYEFPLEVLEKLRNIDMDEYISILPRNISVLIK